MKNKSLIAILTTPIILIVYSLCMNSQTSKEKLLDAIFAAEQIEITIPHHGGYTASKLGKARLEIKRLKNDTTFALIYKDVIDRRQLIMNINKNEYDNLKNLFLKLIIIHRNNKILSGDCLTIDKNYILKTKDDELLIKPDKNSENFNCIDQWIYNLELKN